MSLINSNSKLAKVRIPCNKSDNTMALVDSNGMVIDGQIDLSVNTNKDSVTTATVTFIIGGFVTEKSDAE